MKSGTYPGRQNQPASAPLRPAREKSARASRGGSHDVAHSPTFKPDAPAAGGTAPAAGDFVSVGEAASKVLARLTFFVANGDDRRPNPEGHNAA